MKMQFRQDVKTCKDYKMSNSIRESHCWLYGWNSHI